MLVGNLMLSVIFAGVIFGFYYMLVYKKAYDLFCINFKNKYVLDTLRQLPDFPNCATMPEAVFLMRK